MPDVEEMRLFIAVELPAEIREKLSSLQKNLQKTGADAKWVEPRHIHLTVKFLGNVELEKAQAIGALLDQLFPHQAAFEVCLDEIGCFPSLGAPRVVWAGLRDADKTMERIARSTEEELAKRGFEKEDRPFTAHATLGRIRSPRNRTALSLKIEDMNRNFKKQNFLVDNITLFESRLSPKGPAYSIIHQVRFK